MRMQASTSNWPIMQKLLTLSALLATIVLAGCAPSRLGNPRLQIELPEACERLAQPLPAPQPDAGTDAGEAAAAYAAWGQQNASRMRAYAACQKRVRDRYAAGQ